MRKDACVDYNTILITGVAGFIGSHLCRFLLEHYPDTMIIGIDSLNEYYDSDLKKYRLDLIKQYNNFVFKKTNIADKESIYNIFEEYEPELVINLAAQAGVRYSVSNPDTYIESNLDGFFNMLEACRRYPVKHFVYASSSSVYGNNEKIPYAVSDATDSPESLYAATKKANELMAYAYSKLYDIPATGLRFFSVYGPMGRPDMAYFLFTDKLVRGEKIKLFNYGKCKRDFTYIDDVVKGIINVLDNVPIADRAGHPFKVYNIGNKTPVDMEFFLKILIEELTNADLLKDDFSIEDYVELLPMQPGDVEVTYADMTEMEKDFGFVAETNIEKGLHEFVSWYKKYIER